jgi:hypothetical protein
LGAAATAVDRVVRARIVVGSRAVIAFGRQQFLFLLARDLYDLVSGDGTVTAWDGRAI